MDVVVVLEPLGPAWEIHSGWEMLIAVELFIISGLLTRRCGFNVGRMRRTHQSDLSDVDPFIDTRNEE